MEVLLGSERTLLARGADSTNLSAAPRERGKKGFKVDRSSAGPPLRIETTLVYEKRHRALQW